MQRGFRSGTVKSLLALLPLSLAWMSSAATVGVSFFGLSPNPVNIKVGQVVYWDEADPDFGPYLITGPWGSFGTPNGLQFMSVGTYQYTVQSVFGGGSWGGTVIVSSNAQPVVAITSPTNNSVFTAPAEFAFEADASDPNPDDLSDVEFWVGDTMVDDVFYPPFATTVTNLAAGMYTLKAIAWDLSNARATNSVIIRVVNPDPIILKISAPIGGNFKCDASGLIPGRSYVLEASDTLASPVNWTPVITNAPEVSTASFTNTVTAGPRFFRLAELPAAP